MKPKTLCEIFAGESKPRYGEVPETAGSFVIVGEREKLRAFLISEGFQRVSFTRDYGDGQYLERWQNGADGILIRWAKLKR